MKFLHLYIFATTFMIVWSAPKENVEVSTAATTKHSAEVTESDASAPKSTKYGGSLISGAVQKINDLANGLSIVASSSGGGDTRKPYPVCTENDFYQNPRYRYINHPKVLTLPFSHMFKWDNDDKVPVYNCIFISDGNLHKWDGPGGPGALGVPAYGSSSIVTGGSGFIGEPGFSSAPGLAGAPGFTSVPGLAGASDFAGAQGFTGTSSFTGASGFIGAPGYIGVPGAPGAQNIGPGLSGIQIARPVFTPEYGENNYNEGGEYDDSTFFPYSSRPHYPLPVGRPSDFVYPSNSPYPPNYSAYPYQAPAPFNYYQPYTVNPVRRRVNGNGFYYNAGTQFGFGPKYGASHTTQLWGKRNINDDGANKVKQNEVLNDNDK